MKYCYITFRSVTFAQSAQRTLRKAGIDTILKRTPKGLQERGCGYCLQLRQREVVAAAELLRQEDRAFEKLYLISAEGLAEELAV